MHLRGQMLAEGDYYHVFNRGTHKQAIFTCAADYERFQILLYLLNTKLPVVMRKILADYADRSLADLFLEEPSDKSLVDIIGYALMPTHFHLILRQRAPCGISCFMHKLSTAYSMYFNAHHDHRGVLFDGRYKVTQLAGDDCLRAAVARVHLDPFTLMQPDWNDTGVKNLVLARSFLANYRYSSFPDYLGSVRPETAILAHDGIPDYLKDSGDIETLLEWRSAYTPGEIKF